MTICEDYPLKHSTSFKIGGPARYFIEAHDQQEILEALRIARQERFPLAIVGGGSNVIISDQGFSGLVLQPGLKGIEVIKENSAHVWLRVAAGEIWDDVVARTVEAGWWGIENLSYIPGHAGAFAIQNVGAYGQEATEVIESVEVCDTSTGEPLVLTNSQCRFGYRSSIFNTSLQGKYLILSLVLCLEKHGGPALKYRDVQEFFAQQRAPTLPEIRSAIIAIRREKLPDPDKIGNAGSFFKNLLLNSIEFELFCQKIHDRFGAETLTTFEKLRFTCGSGPPTIKIPTAMILDLCGVKDFYAGGAAVYQRHPLILINTDGQATAHDVLSLMRMIRRQVYRQTGLVLPVEPNLIGFDTQEVHSYFSLYPADRIAKK